MNFVVPLPSNVSQIMFGSFNVPTPTRIVTVDSSYVNTIIAKNVTSAVILANTQTVSSTSAAQTFPSVAQTSPSTAQTSQSTAQTSPSAAQTSPSTAQTVISAVQASSSAALGQIFQNLVNLR